jgi:putative tryptophan/tyrosine transport system substrate-binding protein
LAARRRRGRWRRARRRLALSPRAAPWNVAFFNELQRAGFIEGPNLWVDGPGYGLRLEQLAEHASELVKAQPDVIFSAGDAAIRAAQQATKTIPILAITDDMVGSGLVHSLVKPDGNTTGVSILATELDGKRQEILIEAVPGVRRMAALADVNTTPPQQLKILHEAAAARGVELSVNGVARAEETAGAIDACCAPTG